MTAGQRKTIRRGKATVSWGPKPYGSDKIIANAPLDAFDDLVVAVLAARTVANGATVHCMLCINEGKREPGPVTITVGDRQYHTCIKHARAMGKYVAVWDELDSTTVIRTILGLKPKTEHAT